MSMKGWFSDGHPQSYHIAALVLAVVALGTVFTTTIFAEETGTGNTAANGPESCSYSYGNWSACQSDGKRYRLVTDTSPTGCVQTSEPKIMESCTYSAPQCEYSYSNWGICQSNNKQTRALVSASPAGCKDTIKPVLERSCTYTDTTTNTTSTTSTTTTTTTSCSYGYSNWSTCQSDGKRYRTVTGVSPTGCVHSSAPVVQESCTYTASSTSTITSPTADQCLYTYSNWNTCQSNGKRLRTLLSKSPTGCQEYVRPVLEQSCIYDDATTSTVPLTTTVTTTLTTTGSSTAVSGDISSTMGDVTPTFSFINVSDGLTIRGVYEIKGEVQSAQGVEYYLVPTGSNTYKYIGSGIRISERGWNLAFRSTEFPNGEFYLRAKIRNAYGTYGGGQRKIRIANDSLTTVKTATTDQGFVTLEMNTEEKIAILQQVAAELEIPEDEATEATAKTPEEKKKYIFDYCQSNPEKCFPERDSDKDGLSDIDEVRYGTNPKGADSDLDGFIDGDEVKNGFNPLKYSAGDQSDRIIFESPKSAGEVKEKIYTVQTIELKDAGVDDTGTPKKKMQLMGKGLPNSFVTIYVYSDPIVLTVKTDSEGNWSYELDKELEDGEHEVYVAITDNTGKITAKSQPFSFIKTAQAVTVIPSAEAAAAADTLSVSQNRAQRDILLLVAIVIAALAVTLSAIGFMKHRHALAKEGPIQFT